MHCISKDFLLKPNRALQCYMKRTNIHWKVVMKIYRFRNGRRFIKRLTLSHQPNYLS